MEVEPTASITYPFYYSPANTEVQPPAANGYSLYGSQLYDSFSALNLLNLGRVNLEQSPRNTANLALAKSGTSNQAGSQSNNLFSQSLLQGSAATRFVSFGNLNSFYLANDYNTLQSGANSILNYNEEQASIEDEQGLYSQQTSDARSASNTIALTQSSNVFEDFYSIDQYFNDDEQSAVEAILNQFNEEAVNAQAALRLTALGMPEPVETSSDEDSEESDPLDESNPLKENLYKIDPYDLELFADDSAELFPGAGTTSETASTAPDMSAVISTIAYSGAQAITGSNGSNATSIPGFSFGS